MKPKRIDVDAMTPNEKSEYMDFVRCRARMVQARLRKPYMLAVNVMNRAEFIMARKTRVNDKTTVY